MHSPNGKVKKNRERKFVCRNSLLTDIFEDPGTRNLYNVYVIVFVCLLLQTTASEYRTTGRVTFGLEIMTTGFAHMDKAVFVWCCCLTSTCASFFVFRIWYRFRDFVKVLGSTRICNLFGSALLLLYYFYSFKLIRNAVVYFHFNPPCAVFVTIESVRFLMKVHSFVRTKVTEAASSPKFSNFVYFLFAPTLIYRDSYPRTKTVNWKFAAQCLLECISVLFIFTFIVMNSYPTPEKWQQRFTVIELLLLIMEYIIYGALVLMGTFFLVFHSLQNLFAEILCFGDRLFYLDWWNEYNYNGWLSKWNKIVQEWLYFYVYRDFREYVCDNRFLGRLMVFLVSFGVHEWIMISWIGGFFPIMFFVVVGVMFPLSFWEPPKRIIYNVILWCSGILLINTGLMFYGVEWYARIKAPLKESTPWELLLPRFLTCDCILQN